MSARKSARNDAKSTSIIRFRKAWRPGSPSIVVIFPLSEPFFFFLPVTPFSSTGICLIYSYPHWGTIHDLDDFTTARSALPLTNMLSQASTAHARAEHGVSSRAVAWLPCFPSQIKFVWKIELNSPYLDMFFCHSSFFLITAWPTRALRLRLAQKGRVNCVFLLAHRDEIRSQPNPHCNQSYRVDTSPSGSSLR